MQEFADRLRRNFSFQKEELLTLVLLALTFGFALSFQEWGTTTFNMRFGLFNMLNASLLVLFSLIVHESAHKLLALQRGYVAVSKNWKIGIFVTLFLAFLSNGYLPFLAFGGVMIHHLRFERLGKFRYYTNLWEHALISVAGPLANIMLAFLFKLLLPLNPALMHKAMVINILLCLFNMLPIPPFDGGDVFYSSRLWWVFYTGFFGGLAFMLYYTDMLLYAFIFSLLIGIIAWFIFGTKVDKSLFKL